MLLNFRLRLTNPAFILIMVVGMALLGMGCVNESSAPPSDQQGPLTCDTRGGEYYDFRDRHTCIKPERAQTAYILGQYRYVAELAHASNDLAEFQISFSSSMSVDQLLDLTQDLPTSEATLVVVTLNGFDPERTITVPFTDVALSSLPLALPLASGIFGGDVALQQELSERRYTLWRLRIRERPTTILKWWASNPAQITVVEPRISQLDKVKHGIPPWEAER